MQRKTVTLKGNKIPARIDSEKLQAEVNAAIVAYIESTRGAALRKDEVIEAPDVLGIGMLMETPVDELAGVARRCSESGETSEVIFTFAPTVMIGEEVINIPESVISEAIKAHQVKPDEDTDEERKARLDSQRENQEAMKLEAETLLSDARMLNLLRGLENELKDLKGRVAALESSRKEVAKA